MHAIMAGHVCVCVAKLSDVRYTDSSSIFTNDDVVTRTACVGLYHVLSCIMDSVYWHQLLVIGVHAVLISLRSCGFIPRPRQIKRAPYVAVLRRHT